MSKKKQKRDPVKDGKDIEFYAAFLNGWINNRMELDKSLLTLSTAGIGALLLLRDTFENQFAFHLWVAAGLAFLACICLVLIIFRNNSDYIETFLNSSDEGDEKLSHSLGVKTKAASWLFIIGVSLTLILTIYTTANSIETKSKENQMSEDKNQPSGVVPVKEGLEGGGGLRPSPQAPATDTVKEPTTQQPKEKGNG